MIGSDLTRRERVFVPGHRCIVIVMVAGMMCVISHGND